eukprot:3645585-Pyramimonas_sp.AAC.1
MLGVGPGLAREGFRTSLLEDALWDVAGHVVVSVSSSSFSSQCWMLERWEVGGHTLDGGGWRSMGGGGESGGEGRKLESGASD